MRNLFAAFLLSAFALDAAEAPAADPLKGRSADEWVARLGSDKFGERDEASKVLVGAGVVSEAALRKALDNPDNEIRLRAKLALAAIATVSIEGEFVRIASESFSQSGTRVSQANESGESMLTVKKGQVYFRQEYSKGIEQIYSFDEKTPLTFRDKCELKLSWESINQTTGYNPDSGSSKLECVNTPEGLRITLSATDTSGTSFKMTFAPKAEVEKERAREGKKSGE